MFAVQHRRGRFENVKFRNADENDEMYAAETKNSKDAPENVSGTLKRPSCIRIVHWSGVTGRTASQDIRARGVSVCIMSHERNAIFVREYFARPPAAAAIATTCSSHDHAHCITGPIRRSFRRVVGGDVWKKKSNLEGQTVNSGPIRSAVSWHENTSVAILFTGNSSGFAANRFPFLCGPVEGELLSNRPCVAQRPE